MHYNLRGSASEFHRAITLFDTPLTLNNEGDIKRLMLSRIKTVALQQNERLDEAMQIHPGKDRLIQRLSPPLFFYKNRHRRIFYQSVSICEMAFRKHRMP